MSPARSTAAAAALAMLLASDSSASQLLLVVPCCPATQGVDLALSVGHLKNPLQC